MITIKEWLLFIMAKLTIPQNISTLCYLRQEKYFSLIIISFLLRWLKKFWKISDSEWTLLQILWVIFQQTCIWWAWGLIPVNTERENIQLTVSKWRTDICEIFGLLKPMEKFFLELIVTPNKFRMSMDISEVNFISEDFFLKITKKDSIKNERFETELKKVFM